MIWHSNPSLKHMYCPRQPAACLAKSIPTHGPCKCLSSVPSQLAAWLRCLRRWGWGYCYRSCGRSHCCRGWRLEPCSDCQRGLNLHADLPFSPFPGPQTMRCGITSHYRMAVHAWESHYGISMQNPMPFDAAGRGKSRKSAEKVGGKQQQNSRKGMDSRLKN